MIFKIFFVHFYNALCLLAFLVSGKMMVSASLHFELAVCPEEQPPKPHLSQLEMGKIILFLEVIWLLNY